MKKYIALSDMMQANCALVLEIIQKHGCLSRKDITKLTGLSWGGMTKIVGRLLEHGYILEQKAEESTGSGRIPSLIHINNQSNFVLGLDINKVGFKAIVVNLSGETLKSYSSPVSFRCGSEMLSQITDFVSKILKDFPKNSILAAGIAMQGIVDAMRGISVKFPGLSDWENIPLTEILSAHFAVPFFIEHDPDCMLYALSESAGNENLLLLRLDRSAGLAVSLGGNMLRSCGILEIAHMTAIPKGKKCTCGLEGCLEAYLAPCMDADGAFSPKDGAALIAPLAYTIKNLTELFRADKVMITGTLSKHHRHFSAPLSEKLSALSCTVHLFYYPNDDLAVSGAAKLAVQNAIRAVML